jgi:hypothetical protein
MALRHKADRLAGAAEGLNPFVNTERTEKVEVSGS